MNLCTSQLHAVSYSPYSPYMYIPSYNKRSNVPDTSTRCELFLWPGSAERDRFNGSSNYYWNDSRVKGPIEPWRQSSNLELWLTCDWSKSAPTQAAKKDARQPRFDGAFHGDRWSGDSRSAAGTYDVWSWRGAANILTAHGRVDIRYTVCHHPCRMHARGRHRWLRANYILWSCQIAALSCRSTKDKKGVDRHKPLTAHGLCCCGGGE